MNMLSWRRAEGRRAAAAMRWALALLVFPFPSLGAHLIHAATLRIASAFDPQTMDPRKVDELAGEVILESPDAGLPKKLQELAIMRRAWCIPHGVEKPQGFIGRQKTFAVRNANAYAYANANANGTGTGPSLRERFEPDGRTLLRRNPLWGRWADQRSGTFDEVSLIAPRCDATRRAALVCGEIDLMLDPPVQDIERLEREPAIKLPPVIDPGQPYLRFDPARDELQRSAVNGRNRGRRLAVRCAVPPPADPGDVEAGRGGAMA